MKGKFPLQPLYFDEHEVIRFKENKIVRHLLDAGNIDLNQLGITFAEKRYKKDWEQFYQLIGYSVYGYSELNKVSDKQWSRVWKKLKKLKQKNRDRAYKKLQAVK